MKILANFWDVFSKSVTSPAYYDEILKKKLSFSLKFYFAFFFFYAIILTVIFTATFYWPLQGFLNILPAEVKEVYPEELVITIKDGKASTNVEEPYHIPLEVLDNIVEEFEQRVLGDRTDKVNDLLVIDTQASVEDIENYQTVALLTQSHLVYLEEGTINAVPLKDMQNIAIDRATFQTFVDTISPMLEYALPFFVVFTFLGSAVFVPLLHLVYLAIFSLIILIFAKIISVPIEYKKCYQMSLHLLIMPILLFFVVNYVLMLSVAHIPFLFTIVLAVWTFTVLKKIPKESLEKIYD